MEEEEDGETEKKSKDVKMNKEERRLLECIRERRWEILNERIEEKMRKETVRIMGGRGKTVIDYMLMEESKENNRGDRRENERGEVMEKREKDELKKKVKC